MTDKSYYETKTAEERRLWVEQQRASGNPDIKPRNQWINENIEKIKLQSIEEKLAVQDEKMNAILSKLSNLITK